MSIADYKNPHDRFFREIFGRREMVLDFVKEYLPARVYSLLDPGSLENVKDSYVDKELSQHFSDLVYKASIAGKPSFLYLLFEHKSYVDPMVGFQLLRNMVKIWESYLKQHKRARKLPFIIPLVIYHGRAKWKGVERLRSLFEVEPVLERYIPDFDSEFYDISHIPDEAIRGEVVSRAFLLLLKHVQRPDLLETLPGIFELCNKLANSKRATEYIELFLRYLMSTVESGKRQAFTRQIEKSLKEGGRIMPTIADAILQEGIDKEKLESARKMVHMGMSAADIRKITGLPIDRIEALRRRTQ
jgi:predicted transposase/invertase (TIGR01784 family)